MNNLQGTFRMPRPRRFNLSLVLIAFCSTFASPVLLAGGAPDSLRYSSDVTVELAGIPFPDDSVILDDLLGTATAVDLGPLPNTADVDSYHLDSGGDQLISFDTTVSAVGVTTEPGDVVRFDGTSYSIEFDRSTFGLPTSTNTDAVTSILGDLLISFDTSVDLGAQVARDADLVRVSGSMLSLFFDGSLEGVPSALGIDAAHYVEPEDRLLVSFDGSGQVGGVSFADEDVLEYDRTLGTWALSFDGSAETSWLAADLDALYVSTPKATATLALTLLGNGSGGVVSDPTGIACGIVCSADFAVGSEVELMEMTGVNSLFVGWGGDADCTDGVVLVGADVSCSAEFILDPAVLIFYDGFESADCTAWSAGMCF